MARLNKELLPTLSIPQPQYARNEVGVGIFHMGIGAFHRAHQAYYTEAVMNKYGGDWRILGCSLRSDRVRKQLEPQDNLYTLVVRGETETPQIIGACAGVIIPASPEDECHIVEAIANAEVKIVSFTITEKGYCHHPSTGELNEDHPEIIKDLANMGHPITAIGYIVSGLRLRKERDSGPVTLLSCDNLPDNGRVLEKVVKAFAKLSNPELSAWIDENVTFPATMIDRIVPATTEEDIAQLEQNFGYNDQAMVASEPFCQWVIEDKFAAGRPQWDKVGALLVNDVSIYEFIKLRLLNGSHSMLAYVGYLSGYETIFQTMQDESLKKLAHSFMVMASKTVEVPESFDIADYQNQLIERYGNPGLKHRTWQIAMDGSQKIPQRWLQTLRDLLAKGEDYSLVCLALAAWMRYLYGEDENGNEIELSDPMAGELNALAKANKGQWQDYASAFISLEEVFEKDLAGDQRLIAGAAKYLEQIYTQGMKATVEQFVKNLD